MKKITFGSQTIINPKPALLIGTNVDDKPNFMTAAWCGIVNSEPAMLSVAIRPQRHTYKGVRQNGTLSVNVPSTQLMRETDYCGIFSGAKEDKVNNCKFDIFYGKLKTAPLIEQCPVNLECKTQHELKLGSHILVIVSIEETYVSAECLTDGKPDTDKIKPLIYMSNITGGNRTYHEPGAMLAKAHSVGKELKK